jgi:hypothetical protein
MGAHTAEPKHYDINVKLIGHDSNAFNVIGRVTLAMREAGISREERDAWVERATTETTSYAELLEFVQKSVNVS